MNRWSHSTLTDRGLVPPAMIDKSNRSHSGYSEDRECMSHIVAGGIYPASGSRTCQYPLEREY